MYLDQPNVSQSERGVGNSRVGNWLEDPVGWRNGGTGNTQKTSDLESQLSWVLSSVVGYYTLMGRHCELLVDSHNVWVDSPT